MIIVMKTAATKDQIKIVCEEINKLNYKDHPIYGKERTIIGAIGNDREKARLHTLNKCAGVESVIPIVKPYKLSGKELKKDQTIVKVGELEIGNSQFPVIAGPCSVENEKQLMECAEIAKKGRAQLLRGGAFKPRTSPYSFQGLEEEGLKILAGAREKTGLYIVTELMTINDIDLLEKYSDVIQIGTRNMMNYPLLKEVGQANKPVLLKRGMMARMEELLMASEYIMSHGNKNVILCERGIRTFETATRNTLDLSAVPWLKKNSHLPVIVDPSHGTGVSSLITPMSKAAIAAGADGIMVEIHPQPEIAISDGDQSLNAVQFYDLMDEIQRYVTIEGKYLKKIG